MMMMTGDLFSIMGKMTIMKIIWKYEKYDV